MKIKLLVIILLVTSVGLRAQFISNYGVKIGFISSKPTDQGAYKLYEDPRVSGAFSAFIQFLNAEYARFEFEAGYKQEGAEAKIPVTTLHNPDGTGDYMILDHAFDFVSLNLSVQPKIENKNICLYGILSGSLNFLVKTRDQLYSNTEIDKCIPGFNLGAGFQPKDFLNGKIFIEARYGGAFKKYLKNNFYGAKFNTIQVSLGCYLN